MSWKRIKEATRALGFRLNLWHTAIFGAGALALCGLAYYFLCLAIDQKDREIVQGKLREYAAVYETGGGAALSEWVSRVGEARRHKAFFVRVAKPPESALVLLVPQDWVQEDLQLLENNAHVRLDRWLRVPRDEEVDLTVASTTLRDGALIQVGRASDSRELLLSRFARYFGILIPIVLVLGLAGGAILARRATRPLRDIVEAVRAIIQTGRLDVRVPPRQTRDELQDLALLFNRMLEGNQALFAALRESLDNVAHDLRTPLARLRAIIENALRNRSDPAAAQEALADSLEEAQRVQTIIKTLMDVAQAETGMMKLDLQQTDLGALVDDVIELYDYLAQEKQIMIEKAFPETLSANVDAARMRQVFANLLDNSIKYTPTGGRVDITARGELRETIITFQDNGPGIPIEDLPRIWDRLYRADKSRSEHGLGLGLSLVRAIVQAHGGHVSVTSEIGQGAEFRVILPTTQHAT